MVWTGERIDRGSREAVEPDLQPWEQQRSSMSRPAARIMAAAHASDSKRRSISQSSVTSPLLSADSEIVDESEALLEDSEELMEESEGLIRTEPSSPVISPVRETKSLNDLFPESKSRNDCILYFRRGDGRQISTLRINQSIVAVLHRRSSSPKFCMRSKGEDIWICSQVLLLSLFSVPVLGRASRHRATAFTGSFGMDLETFFTFSRTVIVSLYSSSSLHH
ncbi:hypothetical protein C8J56DRAFT_1168421 [Mycena floridula]|nr:hypothetical protein C8J56DRAFT_1168421 [Mycena floridula]